MFNVSDYLVYGKKVCKVKEIINIKEEPYYVLVPTQEESLTIKIPTKSNKIRKIITKEEIDKLMKRIKDINIIQTDEKYLDSEYKKCLAEDTYEGLIKVIKTTYLKNKKRIDENKKTTDRDMKYFEKAEEYLYNELRIPLNLSFEETKKYVVDKVKKEEKK